MHPDEEGTPPAPPDQLGDELKALRAVIETLQGIPSEARSRVIGYVIRRFPNPEHQSRTAGLNAQAQLGAFNRG
jgi:hypothetical protein